MKILLCAGVVALLLPAGGAVAKSGTQAHAKTHMVHKRAHAVRPVKPNPPKDPWAEYWKDPSRAGPFSYHGFP